jgi:hypothetical protein
MKKLDRLIVTMGNLATGEGTFELVEQSLAEIHRAEMLFISELVELEKTLDEDQKNKLWFALQRFLLKGSEFDDAPAN